MKKVIKLTESELIRIVKTIVESNGGPIVPTHIRRRYDDIKNGVDNFLLDYNATNLVGNFDDFISEVAWSVTHGITDELTRNNGDFVTSRNQMIRFIKTHFYKKIKEYFDRNNYWSKNKKQIY